MPKGGHLSIVPGEVELVVLERTPTAGMTPQAARSPRPHP
jgi:hypothetical protein